MRSIVSSPAAEKPIIAFHTVDMLAANASRTSCCRPGSNPGMRGITAYAISTPAGNWATNEGGKRVLSSFWRMLAEIAIPHVYIAQNMDKLC